MSLSWNEIHDCATEFRDMLTDASLADLYDPLTMPPELSRAHRTLDRAVDKLYQLKPFASDAERTALLFESYKEAIK